MDKTLITMAHLGARAFSSISGEVVQTTVFSFLNRHIGIYKPVFFRLTDEEEEQKRKSLLDRDHKYNHTTIEDFKKIRGSPIAYWVSEKSREIFHSSIILDNLAHAKLGITTGDNDRFIRLYFEVDKKKVCLDARNRIEAESSHLKWFPYNKGGEFRKWYGNNGTLINWLNDGEEIFNFRPKSTVRNPNFYFRQSITWSFVSSSSFGVRFSPVGAIFDVGGSSVFPCDEDLLWLIGFLCSKQAFEFLQILNPTLNFQVGNISNLPILESKIPLFRSCIILISEEAISLTKADWDSYEISWDFSVFPWISAPLRGSSSEDSFNNWKNHSIEQTQKMKELEQENNRIFIEAYELEDELTPDVPEEQITLTINPKYRYGTNYSEDELWTRFREDSIKELISYSIGCMMGRYSLDEPGLIYAHSGNEDFDSTKYKSIAADEDGIIPVMDLDWFTDDATNRFIGFIKAVWSEETLEENLKFIAESLGEKKGEAPIEAIRGYISNEFFRDHIRTYKKRPMYWLFSSGNNKAFECLVYLHRYNEATLSRMRAEYVTPLQGKLSTRIEYLTNEIAHAESTSSKKKLEKELSLIKKKEEELRKFDEELRHYADMRIKLDLDDGVKVNYGKFGNLLAETKTITGN